MLSFLKQVLRQNLWLLLLSASSPLLADTLLQGEAFFDQATIPEGSGTAFTLDDPDTILSVATNAMDISHLLAGHHVLYVRFQDSTGEWSPTYQQGFYLKDSNHTIQQNVLTNSEYWIDTDPGENLATPLTVSGTNNILNRVIATLDLSQLASGHHVIGVRFKDASGLWSPSLRQGFVVSPLFSGENNTIQQAEAFIGTDPGEGFATPIAAADGNLDNVLEAAEGVLSTAGLASGHHLVGIRVKEITGEWSPTFYQRVNYTEKDTDNDGLGDNVDNCPLIANPDQTNSDHDALGDLCDNDDDNDGLTDAQEALLGTNPIKADTDNDGILDNSDAFPLNPQESADNDHDSIGNNTDNCINIANLNQEDFDSDGQGDVCDADDDNDGLTDQQEALIGSDPKKKDSDGDGVDDGIDLFPTDLNETEDTDEDGIGDNQDNCPSVMNTDQLDTDQDGAGDLCDNDADNDQLPDPWEATYGLDSTNPADANLDTDGDGLSNLQEYQQGTDPTVDSTSPMISAPSDIVIEVANAPATINLGTATASDLVDMQLTITADNTGPFAFGVHQVTWTATDDAGNFSTDTQRVEVKDINAVYQVVTPSQSRIVAAAGRTFEFGVDYTTSDLNASLSGLGLRLHFDSNKVIWQSFSSVLTTDLIAQDPQPFSDTEDFDHDPQTDSFISVAWLGLGSNWPASLPSQLYRVNFEVNPALAVGDTSVLHFSASSTAVGYALDSPAITLEVGNPYTWDVDGNGTADALSDGLLVIRYLFGFRGDTLISNAVATGAVRSSASDIEAYLQAMSCMDSCVLDVDGDGNSDALSDGLLVIRYLFGFRGDTLTNGAVATQATRTDIETYMQSFMPQ